MKKYRIEIKWAFIFAAMFLMWMTFEKLAGFHDRYIWQQQFINVLILIPSIVIYVLTLRDKKTNYYSGNISYKQSFVSGIMLTLFRVILSPVNQLIISYIITPDFFNNAIESTVNAGVFTREQAEQQFSIRNYLITGIVGGFVTGLIFSAVISLFVKSKNK